MTREIQVSKHLTLSKDALSRDLDNGLVLSDNNFKPESFVILTPEDIQVLCKILPALIKTETKTVIDYSRFQSGVYYDV